MTTNFNEFLFLFDGASAMHAHEAARKCSNAVNGSCKYEQVLSELPDTAEAALFKDCCWRWIAKMADMYQRNTFDGRNETSCQYAAVLMAMNSVQNKMPAETPFIKSFCEYMSYEHRTLQQCFANLCFLLLDQNMDGELWSKEKTRLPYDGRGWWRMPLV